MRFAIHLKANNDRNGNPRRIFAVMDGDTGNLLELRDEGYSGRPKDVEVTAAFDITNEEYRSCKKDERFIQS